MSECFANGSVSLFERLALEVGHQSLHFSHVCHVHVSCASLPVQIGLCFVAAQMATAWGLEFEASIPAGTDLSG